MSTDQKWTQHPTGKIPHTVALVALGPTKAEYLKAQTPHEPGLDLTSPDVEVWTINTGIRAIQHDLAFVMDDLAWYGTRHPKYGEILKSHDRPIITNKAYPDYPASITYPLGEVLSKAGPGAIYFRNSIPYILAYAYLIGVKRLILFGVDFDYPGYRLEHGRANVEFWIGYLTAKGVEVQVCADSPLMDTRAKSDPMQAWFYGYLFQPIVEITVGTKEQAEQEPETESPVGDRAASNGSDPTPQESPATDGAGGSIRLPTRYLDLVCEVREINDCAAEWMINVAPRLKNIDFNPVEHLDSAFTWDKTDWPHIDPGKNVDFWYRINKLILERRAVQNPAASGRDLIEAGGAS